MNMASSISRLTLREGQGQTVNAVPSVTVGVDSPYRSGPRPHVLSAAFSRLGAQFMGARAGGGCKARRCSIGLSTPVSVAHPFDRGLAVHNRYWSINMANATKGTSPEICPNSSSDSITWVKEQTVIKRVRRALAAKGHYLQKSRSGSDAHTELGEYCVLNDRFVPLSTHCKLPELAKFLGVLADDEMVDIPHGRGWVHQVVRLSQVDGVIYSTPISRAYSTKEAAERAAAKFAGDDVGIHSWDVEVCAKGGTKNGSL